LTGAVPGTLTLLTSTRYFRLDAKNGLCRLNVASTLVTEKCAPTACPYPLCITCQASDCPAEDWSFDQTKAGAYCGNEANSPCESDSQQCCIKHASCSAGDCTGIYSRNTFTASCVGIQCAQNTDECCVATCQPSDCRDDDCQSSDCPADEWYHDATQRGDKCASAICEQYTAECCTKTLVSFQRDDMFRITWDVSSENKVTFQAERIGGG
jgi:hypothetical protein